jgi:hypothetical protein
MLKVTFIVRLSGGGPSAVKHRSTAKTANERQATAKRGIPMAIAIGKAGRHSKNVWHAAGLE